MKLKSLFASISCLLALALSAGSAQAVLVVKDLPVWSIVVDEATGQVTLCAATKLSCTVKAHLATTSLAGNVLISAPPGGTQVSYYFLVMNKATRTGFSCAYSGACTPVTFY